MFPSTQKEKRPSKRMISLCVGTYLFYRAASSQVSSARVSLTAVFGMGTGVPSPSSAPTIEMFAEFYPLREPSELNKVTLKSVGKNLLQVTVSSSPLPVKMCSFTSVRICRSSPRSISTVKLKTSLPLHTQPINHVVFVGSYLITQWDILS